MRPRMKYRLAIWLGCLIARVAMMPLEDESAQEYSNSTEPQALTRLSQQPMDLPELPEPVLLLLERLEEDAAMGIVDHNNIEAYLQQQHTPQDLEQLHQLAALVVEQLHRIIQGSFEIFAQAVQVMQEQMPYPQNEVQDLLRQLGTSAERLQQLQQKLHAGEPTLIQQQQQNDWVQWLEHLQREMAVNATGDAEVQRILHSHLQQLRNCGNNLRNRVQEYELNLWENIDELGAVLQQSSVNLQECLESSADVCTMSTADLSNILKRLDDLRVKGEELLDAINSTDANYVQHIISNLDWAKEVLPPEVRQALAAVGAEL